MNIIFWILAIIGGIFVGFFIFILIFVFDPLAVFLVVSTNVAIVDRDKGKR